MAAVWITYAWEDNKSGGVDFIAQELEKSGITVKLDRWNLAAGRRLWDQIQTFISSPEQSDAWMLIATQNSLQSEACKEELAYALDRALATRGDTYPVIALFTGPVDQDLIPPVIRVRLHVSLTDPDWKERISAAVEGRQPAVRPGRVDPYFMKVHDSGQHAKRRYSVELRPRAGSWSPFLAAIPMAEKDEVVPSISHGPRGGPPQGSVLFMGGRGPSSDGAWWIMYAGNEATPTQSYYVGCQKLPTRLVFGVKDGEPQYQVRLG